MLDLQGKKIAILGFGKEGQAVFEYLTKHDYQVAAVLDSNEKLDDTAVTLLAGTKLVLGPAYMDSLDEYEVIFRSPGVPRLHPKLVAFKDQAAVYSQIKLFMDMCPCPVVAVTGTKGKTTTTTLVYEILKKAGKDVHLGGNIGLPVLTFLDELKPESVVVLELSSFQCQDLEKSPHIGVILNVTPDHLDDGTHRAASHVDMGEYEKAKAQMIANQTAEDVAILHPGLGKIFTESGSGKKVVLNPKSVSDWDKQLLGDHNLENIAAAALACLELGVAEDVIRSAVAEFSGVPQRLQVLGVKNGVTYVNDSASTNPDSTIAAISSFKQPLILIVGGFDKNLGFEQMGEAIKKAANIKGLVVIGQVASAILKAVQGFAGKIETGASNTKEIISQANSMAENGDVILLSPGAASFGMFKNSKDRGQQFEDAFKSL